jgi:hypothetical protein
METGQGGNSSPDPQGEGENNDSVSQLFDRILQMNEQGDREGAEKLLREITVVGDKSLEGTPVVLDPSIAKPDSQTVQREAQELESQLHKPLDLSTLPTAATALNIPLTPDHEAAVANKLYQQSKDANRITQTTETIKSETAAQNKPVDSDATWINDYDDLKADIKGLETRIEHHQKQGDEVAVKELGEQLKYLKSVRKEHNATAKEAAQSRIDQEVNNPKQAAEQLFNQKIEAWASKDRSYIKKDAIANQLQSEISDLDKQYEEHRQKVDDLKSRGYSEYATQEDQKSMQEIEAKKAELQSEIDLANESKARIVDTYRSKFTGDTIDDPNNKGGEYGKHRKDVNKIIQEMENLSATGGSAGENDNADDIEQEMEDRIAETKAYQEEIDEALQDQMDNQKAGPDENEPTPKSELNVGDANINPVANPEKPPLLNPEEREKLEGELTAKRAELAELYARTRRLVRGGENIENYDKALAEYGEMLNNYLRLKGMDEYNGEQTQIMNTVSELIQRLNAENSQKLQEFADDDLDGPKTQEEVDQKREELKAAALEEVNAEYNRMQAEAKDKINLDVVNGFLDDALKLEEATIDALDNGTICRKIVSKVLNNKWLKRGLLVAGVVGLGVVTGGIAFGAIAGTTGVSLALGAGTAIGAARGAAMGGLMSRQSSKTSNVREMDMFGNREEMQQGFKEKGFDIFNEDADSVLKAVDALLETYTEARDADVKSNRKRTAVAIGMGAAIGGLMGSTEIVNAVQTEETVRGITGYEPDKTVVDMSQIDIHRGSGMMETFGDLGGDPNNYAQAEAIAHAFDAQSNGAFVPGSNGETVGLGGLIADFAHTYPGTIDTWPDAAREYIIQVAQAWAEQGLIPSEVIQGDAIYGPITKPVEDFVRDKMLETLLNIGTAAMIGGLAAPSGGGGSERIYQGPVGENVEDNPSPNSEEEAPNSPAPDNSGPTEGENRPEGSSLDENGRTIIETTADWSNFHDEMKRIRKQIIDGSLSQGDGEKMSEDLIAKISPKSTLYNLNDRARQEYLKGNYDSRIL